MQEWMLRLRKRGISVLFLHHSGKNPRSQRGTSKREDLLDVVVALKHPPNYDASQGLRCEIHLEKTRGFLGERAKSFEVGMQEEPTGAKWTISSTENVNAHRAAELFATGMRVRELAEELGISKSTAGRLRLKSLETPSAGVSQRPTI